MNSGASEVFMASQKSERKVPYGIMHSRILLSFLSGVSFYFAIHWLGVVIQSSGWSYVSESLPIMNIVCLMSSTVIGVSIFLYYGVMIGDKKDDSLVYGLFYMKIVCPILVFLSIIYISVVFDKNHESINYLHYLFSLKVLP